MMLNKYFIEIACLDICNVIHACNEVVMSYAEHSRRLVFPLLINNNDTDILLASNIKINICRPTPSITPPEQCQECATPHLFNLLRKV